MVKISSLGKHQICTIYDWRHREDDPVLVVDNGIDWFVLYDVQVVSQVTVFLHWEEKHD